MATARAAGGTVNFADIGVGDPGGDWSLFTEASGWNVNLVAIGNAPSAILNVLVAGEPVATVHTASAELQSGRLSEAEVEPVMLTTVLAAIA